MFEFKDRVSNNNKKRMNILDGDGNITETKIVEFERDDSATVSGTPLNATTFNQVMGEISDSIILGKKFNNILTGQTEREQSYIVPESGTYHIEAAGAKGGKGAGADVSSLNGGQGAIVEADFQLNKGDELIIIVGQKGGDSTMVNVTGTDYTGGGGGGGTFVFRKIATANSSYGYHFKKNNQAYEVLLVAAGGGGTSDASYSNGSKTSGTNGDASSIKTPSNYTDPGTTTFSGTTSSSKQQGGSISQYISYGLVGNMYTRNNSTVYGGYGGGAVADDTTCSGGGWSFSGATAYSWSLGSNTKGITGGNVNDHGYCIIGGSGAVKLQFTLDGDTLHITTENR